MTLFEFILVMVSLLLAIAVAHLLQGVAAMIHRRDELELDWVPVVWTVYLFVLCASHWWSLWDMREADWTFPTFFFVLIPPTLLYLTASLLVSGSLGTKDASMATGFMRIRVSFFVILSVFGVVVTWDGALLQTERAWNSLRALQIAHSALIVLGLISSRRWLQQSVALGALGFLVFAAFVLRFLPGAFGPS